MDDNRYPKHIEDLCHAILEGDGTAWVPLHDALIEAGYPDTAEYHCTNSSCRTSPQNCNAIRLATGIEITFPDASGSPKLIEAQSSEWLRMTFKNRSRP